MNSCRHTHTHTHSHTHKRMHTQQQQHNNSSPPLLSLVLKSCSLCCSCCLYCLSLSLSLSLSLALSLGSSCVSVLMVMTVRCQYRFKDWVMIPICHTDTHTHTHTHWTLFAALSLLLLSSSPSSPSCHLFSPSPQVSIHSTFPSIFLSPVITIFSLSAVCLNPFSSLLGFFQFFTPFDNSLFCLFPKLSLTLCSLCLIITSNFPLFSLIFCPSPPLFLLPSPHLTSSTFLLLSSLCTSNNLNLNICIQHFLSLPELCWVIAAFWKPKHY